MCGNMKTLILLGIFAVALARPADEPKPKSFASAGSYVYTDGMGNMKQVSYVSDGQTIKITSANVTPEEEKVIIEKIKNQNFMQFIPNFGFGFGSFFGKTMGDHEAPFVSEQHDDGNTVVAHTEHAPFISTNNVQQIDLQPQGEHDSTVHVNAISIAQTTEVKNGNNEEHNDEMAPYLSSELESKSSASESSAIVQVETSTQQQEVVADVSVAAEVVTITTTTPRIIDDSILATTKKITQENEDVSSTSVIETITQVSPVVSDITSETAVTPQNLNEVSISSESNIQQQQSVVSNVNSEILIADAPSTEVDINIGGFKQTSDNIDSSIPNNPYPPALYKSVVTTGIPDTRPVREIVENMPSLYVVGEEPDVYAMKIQHHTIYNMIKNIISE